MAERRLSADQIEQANRYLRDIEVFDQERIDRAYHVAAAELGKIYKRNVDRLNDLKIFPRLEVKTEGEKKTLPLIELGYEAEYSRKRVLVDSRGEMYVCGMEETRYGGPASLLDWDSREPTSDMVKVDFAKNFLSQTERIIRKAAGLDPNEGKIQGHGRY